MSVLQPESFKSPSWAGIPDLVAFYSRERQRLDDLYPSELRFLPWLAKNANSILDVGCAAGGFSNIWKLFQPGTVYTGVDLSPQLVTAAKALHPEHEFLVGNCTSGLPLQNNHSEVVQALGWLHWEPGYQEAVRELWRLTGKYLFFDVRLAEHPEEAITGHQSFSFTGLEGKDHLVTYQVNAWPSFAKLLMDLEPERILGYGYWGLTPESVTGVDDLICFATFVLKKRPKVGRASHRKNNELSICLDLPFDWPAELCGNNLVLAKDILEELVPSSTKSEQF